MRRGLAGTRTQAQRFIEEGLIFVAGTPATKAATLVDPSTAVELRTERQPPYASRGGHKLAGALDLLAVDAQGRHALDAGAAHGGFTDVLLRRGAVRVIAVDVAYGQLDWRLREDDRVVVLERTNVRLLEPTQVPPPPSDLVVADLSFISLTLVLPALRAVAAPQAHFLLMVKPQFEAGREAVGRGGVVRDASVWQAAMESVTAAAVELGLGLDAACVSPLPGPSGNIEFFVHLREGTDEEEPSEHIAAALEQAVRLVAEQSG